MKNCPNDCLFSAKKKEVGGKFGAENILNLHYMKIKPVAIF